MKSEQNFVSVIIPVYNGAAFLAEAVESIQRQAYELLEIIIVDDGSTDGTAQVATNFKGNVRYVYQPNSGAMVARNRGLEMARGNVIAFLDADDLWSDNKLELQLAHLVNPSTDVVLGYTQYVRSSQSEAGIHLEKYPESWPDLSFGGAVMRRSTFNKVGFLDQTLPFSEDVDWYLRAKELSVPILVHPEVVRFYRRHEKNITNQKELNNSYFVKAVKKSLDRRRKNWDEKAAPMSMWFHLDESE